MPRIPSLALCLALATVAGGAHAQARDPAAAEGLFQAGKTAMEAGQIDQACALFRQSRDADGAPGTTFHLADCEERRGRLATAWALFGEAAQRLPPGDARVGAVKERAAALEPRLPQLAIDVDASAPQGTVVERDGADLGAATGTFLPVDPGEHAIVVRAPGHAPRTFEVTVVERERRRLPVSVGPATASSDPPHFGGPVLTPAPDAGPSALPTVGMVIAGAGVATIVAGVALALTAQGDYDDAEALCRDDLCAQEGLQIRDDARTLGTVATAVTIVGVAAASTGAVLWLVGANDDEPAPAPRTGRVGVGVSWRAITVRGSF